MFVKYRKGLGRERRTDRQTENKKEREDRERDKKHTIYDADDARKTECIKRLYLFVNLKHNNGNTTVI